MPRTAASPWFLLATALCSGLIVAFASWLAQDSSDGVRATAALVGLGIALALMLSIAWALDEDEPSEATTAWSAAVKPKPAPSAWPSAAPTRSFAPETATVVAAPSSSQARAAFTGRLEEGRALREQLEPAASDARVGVWIQGVQDTIEHHKPGLAGFFNALGARTYADDSDRLDAHIRRLETIIRDFLPADGHVG